MPTKLDDIPEFIMRITREATDKGESLLKLVAGPFLVVSMEKHIKLVNVVI